MEILQQCQIWNGNGEYKKIVDALEAIPAEERTPEMDSDLARAYNNLAAPSDRELFKKAIALLQPHEEYFAGDHCWNFRMGYAYYYLDQEGRALRYFEKALEARPGDEDTEELIESCQKGISLPRFAMCFRERTEIFWETFAEMEAELRQMMDDDKDRIRGAEIVAQMQGALNNVFDEVSFEMGFNGEKHELILTPEGNKVNLFELVYFQKHAPKEVLEHWNILVGRQPMQNIGLRTDDGWEISGDDVLVWLEDKGENSFAISAYCEKLLPMLQENEGRVWWMLTTLTDQVLGEIPHMRYIESFDVLDEPKAEPYFLMSQLPDKLKELGLELSTDPEAYLENYLGYQMKPNEDTDADWRLDVMVGSTNCVPLINGYLSADNDYMDNLHADGVVAGFFCYPLDTLREEEGSQKIFDFRDKLEEVFLVDDGPEVLTLTGGATGLYCGYVDFIAWDISSALNMAKQFFEGTDVPWASFHTFRREAGTVTLKDTQDNEPETEDEEKFSQPEEVSDEPSEVADALMEYLDCECTYFPSMADDDPIMSAYSYAKREAIKKGFVPVLIRADDETLLECLVMNSEPENDDCYEFDMKAVEEYRKKLLAAPVKDAKAVLKEMVGQRKEDAADDDMDWDEDVLGAMEGGFENSRFSSYWNDDTEMTYPVILAKIPVKNPWEIFAYLPFGNWNDCPDTPELMAVSKYWFEQYGAVPVVMSHDELELLLPAPIDKEKAMDVAVEMYGFCPDMDQNFDEIGALADSLWQSTVWYFWWD